jgi:serine protease Do
MLSSWAIPLCLVLTVGCSSGPSSTSGQNQRDLPYADKLYARGMYPEALKIYQSIPRDDNSSGRYSMQEICEVNLKLADMYFRGRAVEENWYVGYYYWLQGLSQAGDPANASCEKGSMHDRERYALESERKKAAEIRMGRLGRREVSKLEKAWKTPESMGLPYIAALTFRRPALSVAESGTSVSPTSTTGGAASQSSNNSGPWRTWTPLPAAICQMGNSDSALNWSEVFTLRSGAIWAVNSSTGQVKSQGSAVAVSPTTLVTNCHVIKNTQSIILLKDGRRIKAKVLAADRSSDRCVLQSTEPMSTYVASARRYGAILVGEDVAAIGNPQGLNSSLSRGIVAQKRERNGRAYIQTDAAISPGSSGGGLFDVSGNLVGITTFKVATGENLNFAVAIEEFCRL